MSLPSLKTIRTVAAVAVIATATTIASASAQIGQLPTRDGMATLAPLIDKAAPAVVNIQVKTKIDIQDNPLFNDPQFRRFFDMPDNLPRQRERQSGGSGVIIDAKKGYVITNHHVVDGASEVAVRLHDEREFEAKVIGSDEGTDVALLQIEAEGLKAMPFGNSDSLKVGDFVVAIGSPFGLTQTVTSGIVSALGRSNLRIEGYEDFIQTDAAINPGNSGGALMNLKGELVGMNTAIFSGRGGGNVGIGFAIPTAMITSVKDQLIEFGEVRRGRIGVEITDLNPDLAKTLGIEKTEGALISRVQKGTPGEEAGLLAEDVVISLDGKPIKNAADLRNRVSLTQFGTNVKLVIIRDGKEKEVKVTLGKMPKEEEVAEIEDRPALQGASFSDDDGVVVTQVERNSPAWQVGLRQNDQIAAVNRKPVSTLKDFRDALDGSKQAALSVKRGEESLFLIIR
ncbi:MAG: DegQ family serine endoprotease [Alphaproteobacteria bacterium]|nr:DegQ family serine endoprotease [Alphaproteobacteria bacterium]